MRTDRSGAVVQHSQISSFLQNSLSDKLNKLVTTYSFQIILVLMLRYVFYFKYAHQSIPHYTKSYVDKLGYKLC